MIKLNKVSKVFSGSYVLDNVSCIIPRNKTTVIIGPSGSGKTTLLKCLAGLHDISEGNIMIQTSTINKGYVFQNYNLWSHMTALENVTLAPLIVQKRDKSKVLKEGIDWLNRVGLGNEIHKYPHQLSGGQQQRVAIARSLLMKPDILLLDEITSSLDSELIESVQNIIRELKEEGRTLVIVTHNLDFAKEIGDQFIFLKKGKLVAVGGKDMLN